MNEQMEQEIKSAVEWWTQQLQQSGHVPDSGSRDLDVGILLLSKPLSPLPETTIEAFREDLRASLPLWLMQERDAFLILSTDYSPEGLLDEVAIRCGIDAAFQRFPIKTIMWLSPGKVTVRCGYGGVEEVLYPVSRTEGTRA